MSKLDAAAVLLTSPLVVIGALVVLGCAAGCAVGELRERRREAHARQHADDSFTGGAW